MALRRTRQPGMRTRPGERTLLWRRRMAGLAYLVVPTALVWLSIGIYNKDFQDSDTITVVTGPVGNEMHPNAEVKLRGVVIGEVRDIDSNGEQARLTLAMKPGSLQRVPADVRAQMLPTTLFGQRYVALVPPASPDTQTLSAGSTIGQDRSANAIELEQALDNLLPLLTAVQPEKLSATLSALSDALEGRGEKIGEAMKTLDGYLQEFNPHLDTLNRDIKEFAEVSNTYAEAAPEIVDALHDATTTSATLAEQRAELSALYASVTAGSQDLNTWLRNNKENIIRLTDTSRPTLEILAEYSPSFPCTLKTVAGFVPAMDAALGKGTDKPGLRVEVKVVESRGKYVPGRDAPSYGSGGGPRCYPVPYTGGSTPASTRSTADEGEASATSLTTLEDGLGDPNSPQENALVTELVAAETKEQPGNLPDWSSTLLGPAFRGSEVSLK